MSTRGSERPLDRLLVDPEGDPGGKGHSEFLLGNEAIARGALEAGVVFAAGYPGTPSSEVTDAFARIAPARGLVFEYSVNEKIALETAFGASLAGARAIVAMKHLGLMYAGDPFGTIPYVGTVGGMVIVSAGDPGCRTSPNEQDQRHLAAMVHVPMLDPSTAQEALEMTRFAFDLSEESRLPVVLRPTTWVCHTRAPVRFGPLRDPVVRGFVRDPRRFVPIPVNARRLRTEIEARLETARRLIAASGFLRRRGTARVAVVTSGGPAAICEDLIAEGGLEDRVSLVVLGAVHPLPESWVVEALRDVDTVLVVEELSPFLEDALRAIASLDRLPLTVLGKRTGHLPTPFEYEPGMVRKALHAVLGIAPVASRDDRAVAASAPPAAPRPPILCVSCPHRSAFFAARTVFGEDALYFNDIGCYTLGYGPPLHTADALLSMGAGFTLAAGVSRTTGRRTVGFMGDSTFFHSGMPALLNAAKERVNMVAVVMDNEVTAMTGFQQSPMVVVEDGTVRRRVDIATVARALGADRVETVDPHDLAATIAAFRRARDAEGLSVVVTTHPCPVYLRKALGDEAAVLPTGDGSEGARPPATYVVLADRCGTCGRASCGHRCGLERDVPYQLALSGARVREGGAPVDRPPVAACARGCPLFLCVQGYAAHIAAGRYAEALELIVSHLPLPDAVCRVCHRPCETVCVRNAIDEPVAVNDLKRFVVDWANAQPEFPYRPAREDEHGRRVAVVGAGPSGLAAAHDLRLRGYEVTLYDADEEPGGLLRTGIPRYRLPPDALRRDVARILATGVRFEGGRRLGRDLTLRSLLDANDAVYLATGAPRGRHLELAGDGPPTVDALRFLGWARDAGGGTGRRVVVVGGGNSAIDAARVALRTGATTASVVCLESRAEMPADAREVAGAEQEGVRVLPRRRVVRRLPEGAAVVDVSPSRPGAREPEDFVSIPGTEHILEADQIVVAIGQRVDRDVLAKDDVDLDWRDGCLRVATETGRTSDPRVFAGGDVTTGGGTVTDAIARGLRSAWAIDASLRGPAAADRRPPPPLVESVLPRSRSIFAGGVREARRHAPELDPTARLRGFDEVVGAFSEREARAEAERCMVCGLCGNCRSCVEVFGCPAFHVETGAVRIDPSLCVACGVCAAFCPNDAIVPQVGAVPASAAPTETVA